METMKNRRPATKEQGSAAMPDWAAWLDENAPRLLLYARQQTRREADAEDVLQEALVQLVRAVESGSFEGGPEGWRAYAFTAIRHLAADSGRREEVRRAYAAREQEHLSEGEEECPWLTSAADDAYLKQRVEGLLKTLSPEFAEVLVLKIWGEHTFQEIADMTHTKLATITSRYRYALQALRRELEANPIDLS